MKLEISRFRECDLDTVLEIQRSAFKPLYEKYQDEDTSPYLESRETILRKYTREGTVGYIFFVDQTPAGAVRIVLDEGAERGRV